MLRTALCSTLATLGLAAGTATAADGRFPSIPPSYKPDIRYQYGFGVTPSFYHRGPIRRQCDEIYTVEVRRRSCDGWRVVSRTCNEREARQYARYLRSLGYQARVEDCD